MSRTVYILRPYPSRICTRMFEALRKIGLQIDDANVVPEGSSDAEVIAWLRVRPTPAALLIPFHAHRDQRGELVHGLELIRRVQEQLPHLRDVPVFSPISNLGLAAAGLMMARYEEGMRFDRTLFVYEDELDDHALLHTLHSHWREHGSVPALA